MFLNKNVYSVTSLSKVLLLFNNITKQQIKYIILKLKCTKLFKPEVSPDENQLVKSVVKVASLVL